MHVACFCCIYSSFGIGIKATESTAPYSFLFLAGAIFVSHSFIPCAIVAINTTLFFEEVCKTNSSELHFIMTSNNQENIKAQTPSSQQVAWSAGEGSQASSLLARSLQPELLPPWQQFCSERLSLETVLAPTDRFCETDCVAAAAHSVISMAALSRSRHIISREGDDIDHSDGGNRFFITSDSAISPLSRRRNLMEIVDSAIELISEDLAMPFSHHSALSYDYPHSRSAAQ